MKIPFEIIEKYGQKIIVDRKEIITPIGGIEEYLYFVYKGLVRMFVLDSDGQ